MKMVRCVQLLVIRQWPKNGELITNRLITYLALNNGYL